MKIAYLLTALLLSFNIFAESGVRAAQSDSADIVRVKGKGAGTSKEAALKDAFRKSVENAVGMFVDAELLADNDQLVQDKILTHCNAYIEQYEEKKCIKHDGVTEVVIVAWVRRGDLTQKLRDVMPAATLNVSEFSKNLYAQIVTQDKRDADAEELLKDVFNEFDPLSQLMKLSIENTPEVSQPKAGGSARTVSCQLRFQIDEDNYFKVWMPRIDTILSQVSLTPGCPFSFNRLTRLARAWKDNIPQAKCYQYAQMYKTEYFSYDELYYMSARLFDAERIILGRETGDRCGGSIEGHFFLFNHDHLLDNTPWSMSGWSILRAVRRYKPIPQMKAKSLSYVALVKRVTYSGCTGTLYELSDSSAAIISDWLLKYSGLTSERRFGDSSARATTVRVSFMDAANSELASGRCRAYNHDMSNVGCVCWGRDASFLEDCKMPENTIPYVFYITPWVGCFAGECSTWVDVDVKTDDIPKIATISASPENGVKTKVTQLDERPGLPSRRGLLSRRRPSR